MFIKNLRIENDLGPIREIDFHIGLNLIVDETPTNDNANTGNNVGKTTVLALIDFCLGSTGKEIYSDPENRRHENTLVKQFLIDSSALITLTLKEDLSDPVSREYVIQRNFQLRKKNIRRIDGNNHANEEEFLLGLTKILLPGHLDSKPTFRQIISHNIRYKELGLVNTLKILDRYTRGDEYETLFLFLFGCDFEHGNTKQNLLAQIRIESSFKHRLEGQQTLSAYQATHELLSNQILELNKKKSTFNVNADFESDLMKLDAVKRKINSHASLLGRLRLRRELILEATTEIKQEKADIDLQQLKAIYEQASNQILNIQKTFEELYDFHNRMVEEKARYISKEIPELENEIRLKQNQLDALIAEESRLSSKVTRSNSFVGLEALIIEINEKYRQLGEFEIIIKQIEKVDDELKHLDSSLAEIDNALFSDEFAGVVRAQLNKFNKHFSAVSRELYDEQYAIKFDVRKDKNDKRYYEFTTFNTNFSSGKKQGEISCFDIAYTAFADQEKIPCFHFLLNDKKELMHDNQLIKISQLVGRKDQNIQFIASILKDKLPLELNDDKYFVLKLSQNDKLFRIESI